MEPTNSAKYALGLRLASEGCELPEPILENLLNWAVRAYDYRNSCNAHQVVDLRFDSELKASLGTPHRDPTLLTRIGFVILDEVLN
jgi:hypothetical protein